MVIRMKILNASMVILMLLPNISFSYEQCPSVTTTCENTTLGKMDYIWGVNTDDNKAYILLNGKKIFEVDGNTIGGDIEGWLPDENYKKIKIIVYYNFNDPKKISEYFYRDRAYRMFDFSGDSVVISNEFYPPADYDAPIKWVSWGQKNSVIAFEDGSRFRYEKGQVTMIKAGSENNSDN